MRSPKLLMASRLLLLSGLSLAASWVAQRVGPPRGLQRCAEPRAMFSGIVEEMGTIRRLEKVDGLTLWDGSVGEGWEMEVEASEVLGQASLGCSIAVNGVCLTVTEFDEGSFSVGLAPETIRRSNLVKLKTGDPVNLERALPADGRNSGHFVQGHVDDVGILEELLPDGDSLFVKVRPPARLLPYIVPKGFIAVDGTSLTVCEVNYTEGWFNFMLVAYTQQSERRGPKPSDDQWDAEDLGDSTAATHPHTLLGRIPRLIHCRMARWQRLSSQRRKWATQSTWR